MSSRSKLSNAQRAGRVLIWSRVENEALAEIYSRSMITVMPSLREQFGLVAVESMMSGTPVVAFATGGLQDVILDEITGVLIEEHDSSLLANTIASYLRNPDRRRAHGNSAVGWARFAFERERVYGAFERAYTKTSPLASSAFKTAAMFRGAAIASLREILTSSLGEEVVVKEDLTTSRHLSFRVESRGISYFCKQYSLDPSVNAMVYAHVRDLNPPRSFDEYAGRIRFHAGNPFVPAARFFDNANRLILFEWCSPPSHPFDVEAAIGAVSAQFRSHLPLFENESGEYLDAVSSFARTPSRQALQRADVAAAHLNSRTIDGIVRHQQTHPQLELWRIADGLERRAWSLPTAVSTRMLAIISFLHHRIPMIVGCPTLCHGGLKPSHLLNRGEDLVSCDLDGSRYVVGPFDEAQYVWHQMNHHDWPVPRAITALGRLLPSYQERALGICWFFVDLLFFGVLRSAGSGKSSRYRSFLDAADALPTLIDELLGDNEPRPVANMLAVPSEGAWHLV